MSAKGSFSFWRPAFLLTFLLTVLAGWDVLAYVLSRPIALFASNWTILLAFFLLTALVALGLLGLSFNETCWKKIACFLDGTEAPNKAYRVVFCSVYVLILPVYTVLTILLASPLADIMDSFFTPLARVWQLLTYSVTGLPELGIRPVSFPNLALRLWAFWILGLLAAILIRRGRPGVSHNKALVLTLFLQAAIHMGTAFAAGITPFPFSLDGWSEASRYYYASLPYAKDIYGFLVPLSVWHPTRYFLQAIPFLVPSLPLSAHRAWQVLLWIGTASLTACLLTHRLRTADRWIRWAFTTWTFLFLLETSVYYHLLIGVILVLAGFSLSHPKRTLVIILLASFWAGMSRLNWFPVPAVLAALLYFLESRTRQGASFWSYFSRVVLWGTAGTATAFLAQFLYIRWSGNNDARAFGSSLTSDLLWYRLLPNPTYSPGILVALVLVALPVLLLIAGAIRQQKRISGWPLAGLIACLSVLLLAGLVVSVKIGGGGDLHNMDAFLVAVMTCAGYLLFGSPAPKLEVAPVGNQTRGLLTWVTAITILFAIVPYISFKIYDQSTVDNQLADIRLRAVSAAQSGEVLFISQRHLVTFDTIDVPLSPDYELLTLMEMALSGNTSYLDAFHADLRADRFSLIIAPEQKTILKGAAYSFGEENDAWTENVAPLILCYYESVQNYPNLGVQLLVPRSTSGSNCDP